MPKPNLAQIAFLGLLTFSIAIAAISLGCAQVPKFPVKYIWETDVRNGVCGQYEIIDPKRLQVKHIKDWDLTKCDGVFGFSTEDTPKVLDWCSDLIVLAEKNCQK